MNIYSVHSIGFDVMGYVLRDVKHFHGLEIAKQMTLLWKNECRNLCVCSTRTGCHRYLVNEKIMAGWRRHDGPVFHMWFNLFCKF